MIKRFISNGEYYMVTDTPYEGAQFKNKPFCLFEYEGDFDDACWYLGNFESLEAAMESVTG